MPKTATPERSFIAVTINMSQTGSSVRKSIKFLNRKGKFRVFNFQGAKTIGCI